MMAAAFSTHAAAPQVADIYPEPTTKSDYNLFTYPELMLYFDRQGDTRFELVELRYETAEGGTATVPIDYREQPTVDWRGGSKLRFDFLLKDAITSVKDVMTNHSVFTVVIKGATVNGEAIGGRYVNDAGDIELSYRYSRLTAVKDVSYPDPFLSYYTADNPEGKIVVELDDELAPLSEQTGLKVDIHIGAFLNYLDSGDDWPLLPAPKVEISGRYLTLDLTETVRETEEKDLNVVTVMVMGLRDKYGLEVDFWGGNLLRIFDIPYVLLAAEPLMYEFAPTGGSLAGRGSVELWVGAPTFRRVDIQGFRYAWADGEAVLGLDEIGVEEDEFDAGSMIYTVPVPKATASAEGEVVLSAVVESLDGHADTTISTAFFNDSPTDSGVAALPADGETDDSAIYTLDGRRVVPPLAPGIYVSSSGRKIVVH